MYAVGGLGNTELYSGGLCFKPNIRFAGEPLVCPSYHVYRAERVLLATPNPSPMRAVFQNLSAPDFYRKLAEAQHVPLIEDAIADVLSDPKLKGDALHPNAEGHGRLAEKIYKELQSLVTPARNGRHENKDNC